ncbi:glycosyltransferase [Cohnella sp. AR92]|uniref:glycosyltransferase n=1 Tax=Cohnella sp. AR92 TaxID=648716 RepID=UPI000F8EE3D8|nr:glycosyltransferase [Cohnella sp. AR92]RUS46784.1 glycosyltransferase family 1 protein [Cohnella sp. AR92]
MIGPERSKVLMVMDSLAVGGTETHVLSLVKALGRVGIQPYYAGAGGRMYEAYARAGCPMYKIDLTPGRLLNPSAGEAVVGELRRIMRFKAVRIVHVHQTPSGVYAAIAARELGIPVVFTVHGAYYSHEQLREMKELGCLFISVSLPVQAYLNGLGIESELVPNAVDPLEFYPGPAPSGLRESLGIPDAAPVVVYASRLAWDKAAVCSMLIRAAARIKDGRGASLHLVVVGDGNQYEEIKRIAQQTQKETGRRFIHLVGSQTRIRDYLALGDLVVGTGRVALEAMHCAKPVLAIGNHGYFGMVEPQVYDRAWEMYFGDHASERRPTEEVIADRLALELEAPDRLRWMGNSARKWASERFGIDRIGESLRRIYGRAAEAAREGRGSANEKEGALSRMDRI